MSVVVDEYIGLENESESIIVAISDFCFNMATGKLVDAMAGMNMIKNESVWEIMAKLCVKLRNIKMARICLARLKNAKALRTSAPAIGKPVNESSWMISLAIQLGMYDEAQQIMAESGNFEAMSEFYEVAFTYPGFRKVGQGS